MFLKFAGSCIQALARLSAALFVLSGAYRPGPRGWIVEHQSIILAIENKIFRVYLWIEAFG
jgi:hypothetical protein